jgi:hypothetical protein
MSVKIAGAPAEIRIYPARSPVSGATADRHLALDLSEGNILFVNKHVIVIKVSK